MENSFGGWGVCPLPDFSFLAILLPSFGFLTYFCFVSLGFFVACRPFSSSFFDFSLFWLLGSPAAFFGLAGVWGVRGLGGLLYFSIDDIIIFFALALCALLGISLRSECLTKLA